jgi:L-2,4-diaminobutyrate transaminase
LRRYDILLIADEVITGFGRTGAFYGSELYDIKPDLVSVAKGLTSAYVPMSASIVGDRVSDVLEAASDQLGVFSHGFTYSGHPLGAAAANAVLDIVDEERLDSNAAEVGAYLQGQLHAHFDEHPYVGEVRGVGLLAAVEFMADRESRRPFPADERIGPRVAAAAYERGLIARALPQGDILGFSPPLIVTKADIDEIVATTVDSVNAVLPEMTAAYRLEQAIS